jgi:hypothetical protein
MPKKRKCHPFGMAFSNIKTTMKQTIKNPTLITHEFGNCFLKTG